MTNQEHVLAAILMAGAMISWLVTVITGTVSFAAILTVLLFLRKLFQVLADRRQWDFLENRQTVCKLE